MKLLQLIKPIAITAVFLFNLDVFAQELPQPKDFDKVVTLTDFWGTVFKDDTIDLELEHIYVTTKDSKEYEDVREKILSQKKTVRKSILINNVYFKGYYHDYFRTYYSGGFNIDSTTFLKSIDLNLLGIQGIYINNCKFKDQAKIVADGKAWLGITIDNCKFDAGYFFGIGKRLPDENKTVLRINNSTLKKGSWEWFNHFDNIYINGSSFLDTNINLANSSGIFIQNNNSDILNFEITNSIIESPINAYDLKISNHFQVINTKLSYIGINNFKFPDDIYEFKFKWDILDSSIAYLKEYQHILPSGGYTTTYKYFNLYSDSSIILDEIHDLLKSKAYQILSIYKAQGDFKSYNACYNDIKHFENKRLKYDYKINPTFEGWFHWRLNELISSYSDYGTNPAKAVIKSLWVILLFSFFYMLFPSEWDISSKSAIIANFKQAINKKEKTTSPLLKALLYLIVSFVNAFTLSINSFVTLGFGHIPTKGIAKYFTIFQGLIGWFLLTIFSVSLISQVLN